jgi:hypothetical protein
MKVQPRRLRLSTMKVVYSFNQMEGATYFETHQTGPNFDEFHQILKPCTE